MPVMRAARWSAPLVLTSLACENALLCNVAPGLRVKRRLAAPFRTRPVHEYAACPTPSGSSLPCNGAGTCAAGTGGSAQCVCHTGYLGDTCSSCSGGFIPLSAAGAVVVCTRPVNQVLVINGGDGSAGQTVDLCADGVRNNGEA